MSPLASAVKRSVYSVHAQKRDKQKVSVSNQNKSLNLCMCVCEIDTHTEREREREETRPTFSERLRVAPGGGCKVQKVTERFNRIQFIVPKLRSEHEPDGIRDGFRYELCIVT